MHESKRSTFRPRTRVNGFSLVEMLVALVFVSLLMAGMFNVFAAITSSFVNQAESMAVQQKARWGLSLLQDEVLQAGYLMPVRIPEGMVAGATSQPPILMQQTTYTPPGGSSAVDEFQMVYDIPLNIQGTATKPVAIGDNSIVLKIPSGGAGIQAGDLLFVQDSAWELLSVIDTSGTGTAITINIQGDPTALLDPNYGTPLNPMVHASFEKVHLVGAPVTVIRPLQIVRYTVVPRALDPSDPTNLIPCLVRQSRPLAGNATTIWAPVLNTLVAGEQVLLENVVGFAMDWSLDGGKTWLRAGGAGNTWATIGAALDTKLKASTSPLVKQAGGGFNAANPMWMNYAPLLIRLDLTTRSEIQRSEFNTAPGAPALAYRTRRETMFFSPRNFALGAP